MKAGQPSLKTEQPAYKPVARLQTGQVCNRFATYTAYLSLATGTYLCQTITYEEFLPSKSPLISHALSNVHARMRTKIYACAIIDGFNLYASSCDTRLCSMTDNWRLD